MITKEKRAALSSFTSTELLQELMCRKDAAERDIVNAHLAQTLVAGKEFRSVLLKIAELVSEHFVITVDQLRSESRKSVLVQARRVFAALAIEVANKPDVYHFLNRDNSTILHLLSQRGRVKGTVDHLREVLKNGA